MAKTTANAHTTLQPEAGIAYGETGRSSDIDRSLEYFENRSASSRLATFPIFVILLFSLAVLCVAMAHPALASSVTVSASSASSADSADSAASSTGAASSSSASAVDSKLYDTVRVGMFLGEGYATQNDDGSWSGIDIEITENIAQTAGFDIEFVVMESAHQGLEALDDGTIDMLADIAKTDEREQDYLFSEYEQGNVGTNIFVREDDSQWDYENYDQLKAMTFSCEKDNIAESDFLAWCEPRGIKPTIVEYDTGDLAADAVRNGEADGYIDGEDSLNGFRSILSFAPSSYYFVFAKDNTALKMKVDAALAQIYIDNPLYEKELLERYLGLTQNGEVSLSEDEQEYVASHSTVSVAVLNADEPYFWGTEKDPQGIVPEFYAKIAAATGLNFEFKVYDTQEDAIAAMKSGDVDVIGIFSAGLTKAYDQQLSITRKYTTVSTVMITNADTSVDDVKRIAVKDRSSSVILQKLPDNLQDAQLVSYNTAGDCFAALTRGAVDAIIIGLPSATYLVNQHNSSAYTIVPVSSVNLELCAATMRENHTLLSVLNKGIKSTSYTIDGIITNNTASRDNLQTVIAKIPAIAIVIFAIVMILVVVLLLSAVISLSKNKRRKIAAMKAEAEANEQRIKAESYKKSADEKNAFFANISHDMRTPLNAVIGFAGLGEKTGDVAKKNEYFAKISASGELLNALINDTLTASKVSSGKLQLRPEPVKPKEVLASLIESIEQAALKRNITFSVDMSKALDRTVMMDPLNVQKICMNLLTNAIKYTPEGGHVTLKVYNEPSADGKGPDSLLEVKDDGIGIDPDFLPKIFQPFSQEKRRGYEGVGTGLGLSIVKQLVDLMGGTIEAQSEKNKGTTFIVRLHFDEVEPEEVEEQAAVEQEPESTLNGMKVLLCEDNELNREIAVTLLEGKGVVVVSAADGLEGLRMFSESTVGEYDAVLMDIRMPVMDGFESTRAIRALERADAKKVPIIAMTADAFSEDVQRCLAAGMSDHIAKPVDPLRLFAALLKCAKTER